jgi:hypothetical protein
MARPQRWFTVIERIEALGIQPEKKFDWAVGRMVRDRFEARYDRPPVKELCGKTSAAANGQHCFAIYPPEFRPHADCIILNLAKELSAAAIAQQSLFPYDD